MAVAIVTPDQDAIVSEVEIAAPPERVFEALTDAKQLAQWWTSKTCSSERWEMDARPGGKWRSSFTASEVVRSKYNLSALDHRGEIVEIDPPRLLVYSWFANFHEDPSIKTEVRWELTEIPTGTKLKVTHRGLSRLPMARKDYSGGWPSVVGQLKTFVEKH